MLSLVGGILIGVSVAVLWIASGRVAGISGIVGDLVVGRRAGEGRWRVAFVGGLLVGGVVMSLCSPGAFAASPRSLGTLALAGLCVGFGTRLGSGCTSGHGLCGVSRLSPRSLVATGVFMAVGMAAVLVAGRLLQGAA